MSGGSYNYMYFKVEDDPLNVDQRDLETMAERLAEMGYHDAARETYECLLDIRATRARFEARAKRMADVWHAVEWFDSGDYGREQVTESIEKYRRAVPA